MFLCVILSWKYSPRIFKCIESKHNYTFTKAFCIVVVLGTVQYSFYVLYICKMLVWVYFTPSTSWSDRWQRTDTETQNCFLVSVGRWRLVCLFVLLKRNMVVREEVGIRDFVLLDEITVEKFMENLRKR